ncbi:adenosine kinase [Desulfosudis oleivorans]|uniref:PfkB domain protein n=1 Tax=Desulfosudis oleivorans (strain DSM 6200 / JCM 39069 / Hxd3) TaxID=96561 RepID=A8ZYD2_DESOH|nr:adenosine kinase [Desulfosudis oleivorans]ABW68657.1 PfkB domain protein [Desulfosudis oleivorans Hxd3]
MIKKNTKRITGVGSALVDLLALEEDTFLQLLGSAKGGMTLVESEFIERAIERASRKPAIVSGGSACNTVAGVGMLGGDARFIGVMGQDTFGELFHFDLKKSNVEAVLSLSASPTGKVLSVITPDAQRTMFTCLGASTELNPAAMNRHLFEGCAIVVVEGYLLFNPALMLATVRAAKEAGALVSLDLASFDVVNQSRDLLETLVADYVDILIANEDEAHAYTGHTDALKALAGLSRNVTIAALKVGALGSYLSHAGEVIRIEPQTDCPAIDTTGAGDLWAAGFLYGLVNGYSLDRCGALGSACGYEVCQVIGAKIPDHGWKRIRSLIHC